MSGRARFDLSRERPGRVNETGFLDIERTGVARNGTGLLAIFESGRVARDVVR